MQDKKHHIQNKCKILPWYLINGVKCTAQNILMSLNIKKVCKIQGNTDLILGGAQCAELTSLNGTGGLGGGGETERYAPKKLMHSELFGS